MKTAIVVLAILFAVPLAAATPDKGALRPAWEWTDEQRAGARMEFLYARKNLPKGAGTGLDGAEHPELYFPWELFQVLVVSIDDPNAEERQRRERTYEPAIRRFTKDEHEFWVTFEKIAEPFVATTHALREPMPASMPPSPSGQSDRSIANCRARYLALQEARRAFPEFDRLLYEVVAPTITSSSGAVDESAREGFLKIARGCR